MLADGAAGRLPPDHQIPKDELDLFLKDQRTLRETRCLPLSYLPAPAQSCLNQVHQELDESIRRAVKLMRWRFALPGSHNPFSARVQAERFTLDGAEWHSVPSNLQLSIVGLSSFRLTETHRRTLGELLEGAAEEPLGHELLREAVTVRDTAPRSALLIGVSALEVGVKELIGKLAPSAAWMAENLPSPPS
jgi:hypothetical protein